MCNDVFFQGSSGRPMRHLDHRYPTWAAGASHNFQTSGLSTVLRKEAIDELEWIPTFYTQSHVPVNPTCSMLLTKDLSLLPYSTNNPHFSSLATLHTILWPRFGGHPV
jgi:hypothetical protein